MRRTATPHRLRGRLTDPLVPMLALAIVAVLAALAAVPPLTWAVLGGLAGYSLSGSV